MKSLVLAAALATVPVLGSQPAIAQSLRDAVKQHVNEGIEQSREKQKKRTEAKESKPAAPTPRAAPAKPKLQAKPSRGANNGKDADVSFSIGDGVAPSEDGSPAPSLPHRFWPDYLQLDLQAGGGYRGWAPQQYNHVAVKMGHYFTWNVSVRARIPKIITLHEGYFESNSLAGPRTKEAAVLAEIGGYVPKAAWLLGMLGIPILKIWEPIIRYESRAFRTRARPEQPVCIIPQKNAPQDLADCPRTTNDLNIVSGFETLVLGVRYDQSQDTDFVRRHKGEVLPPIFFGVGLMSYSKPYQLVVDGATLDDLLFDARFRGAGLALGGTLGRGINRFVLDANVQVGAGEVVLTDGLSLNEVLPSNWVVGYLQGNATLSISIPLWRFPPTLMFKPSASFGGAAFYLIETDISNNKQATTPNINWDILWSAQAALVLSL